jgi:hypothetical protein
MLTQYQTRTKQLLQNPSAPTSLYSNSDLTTWINQARGQLAGEAECIRVLGTISTSLATRNYSFSSLNLGVAATTGVRGAIHVRSIRYAVASGFQWIAPRPWEWFELYYLNNPVPDSGPPTDWSQYAQGSAGTSTGSSASGSFFINPLPDMLYTLTCDCVCYPIDLVDDTTVEALPFLWTDAVAYFAAYLALLSSQTNARRADAEAMFSYYQTFTQRARQFSNPSLLRSQYAQAADMTLTAKLGLQKSAGG